MKRYIGRDGFGTDYTFHYDHSTKKCVIQETMDAEPIIEWNKERQKTDGYTPSRQRKLLASIPLTLVHKWMVEDGVVWFRLSKQERFKYLRRKWNDPDFRFLRASGGRGVTGRVALGGSATSRTTKRRHKLVVPDVVTTPRETINFGRI